ncbi:MAG: SpaA isopeptide-forming pilin-related protein [Anaerococcus sp.]|nr:SpaA isopeptide-forming pilin-related protein [Peptoniphilaceae bacterium]MDY3055567.1 SpaA isopeptide-forming pilin-related protein [Anaerococcus sp.]
MGKKKTSYFKYLLSLVLILVAPLVSFAEDGAVNSGETNGIGPIELRFEKKGEDTFEDISFDYWEVKPKDLPDSKDTLIGLANMYEKMTKAELDEELGTSYKTGKTVKLDDEYSLLNIDSLPEGVYLFKVDDESFGKQKDYYIPAFFLKVDENLEVALLLKQKDISITLNKVDSQDEEPLSNVVFELYEKGKSDPLYLVKSEDGNYHISDKDQKGATTSLVTNASGQIKVYGLDRYKKYYFKEIKAKSGYIESSKNSKDMSYGQIDTIKNDRIPHEYGKIKFVKIDTEDDSIKLKGAKFVLCIKDKKTGKYYKVPDGDGDTILVSDENGEFEIDNLPFGHYRLQEIEAPKGYEISTDSVDFEISKINSGQEIQVKFVKNKAIPDRTPGRTPGRKPDEPTGGKIPSRNPSRIPSRNPSSIVKTGDIKILLFLGAGLALIGLGINLLKKDKVTKK